MDSLALSRLRNALRTHPCLPQQALATLNAEHMHAVRIVWGTRKRESECTRHSRDQEVLHETGS
eukprot:8411093-Alexandrium_andersonii.AAC.1